MSGRNARIALREPQGPCGNISMKLTKTGSSKAQRQKTKAQRPKTKDQRQKTNPFPPTFDKT